MIRFERCVRIGAVLAALAGLLAAGCDPAQMREWTKQASIVELGLINGSQFMPADTRLSADQVSDLGAARADWYAFYGNAGKEVVDSLKE